LLPATGANGWRSGIGAPSGAVVLGIRAMPELYSFDIRYGNPMPDKGVRYKEVVRAPLWLIAFIYFLILSLVMSIWAALGNTPALVSLGILSIWVVVLYFKTALRIEVDERELRVGGARIEHSYIGEVTALSPVEMKATRTRNADASAYLAIRFWSSNGLKLQVSDPRDPTPYWLITSTSAEKLIKALKP
jgi:hypothetical protein